MLADKIADSADEFTNDGASGIIFGKGFGVITDIQVEPDDGYLYVLTYDGTIFRISSSA